MNNAMKAARKCGWSPPHHRLFGAAFTYPATLSHHCQLNLIKKKTSQIIAAIGENDIYDTGKYH